MKIAIIIAVCAISIALIIASSAYICFYLVFYVPKRVRRREPEEFPIPHGEIYEPYRESMIGYIKKVREMPHTDMEITSFDGLKLRIRQGGTR